jgi:tetratricopeptide (TPR) repeat protein
MASPEPGSGRRLIGVTLAALLLPSLTGLTQVAANVEPVGTATGPTVRVRDLGAVEVHTAALLLSGQSGGDLPGAVLWCAGHEANEDGRVPTYLNVELDGRALLHSAPPDRVPLVVAAYAIDEMGAVVGSLAHGVVVDGEGHRAALASGGLRFVGAIALPLGSVSLRVMVQVHGTQHLLLTREELRLVPAGTTETVVSVPLFSSPEGSWLEARQQGVSLNEGCVDGVIPAARPVLDVTRPMSFVAIASGWPQGARLQASVTDGRWQTFEQPMLSIVGTRPIGGGKAEIIEVEILPFDVPAGVYRVTLQVMTDTFEELAARDLDAVLVRGETSTSWAGLGEPAGEAPGPAQVTAAVADKPDERQILSVYMAALWTMARGDEMAARRTVAELERRVSATYPASGLAALLKAELRVARRLEDIDPRSLQPLIVLHRNLCHTYTAYQENVLARQSAMVVAELAEIIGTISEGPPTNVAEYALVSVALDLQMGVDHLAGGELLERALNLEPKSIPALMNLAALRERTGRWSEAVELLQTLVTEDPGNLEARLRLGVNLRRTRSLGAARGVLRSLLADSTPEWIRSIAAQELAHLLVEEGSLDQAERVLVRAIDSVADQQSLAIQLLWTRDLAGRAAEVTTTLALIEQDVGRRTDSARLRYCQWPDMGVYGIGITLRRAAEDRLPDLRRALDAEELR